LRPIATTDGVDRSPSALTMIAGSSPCRIAAQELVVPKSIPMTAMVLREGGPKPSTADHATGARRAKANCGPPAASGLGSTHEHN
jgi:hypothetical protein